MILVVGAAASGKRDYVRSLGYDDSSIADAFIDDRPVLVNLQDLVLQDPGKASDLFDVLLGKEVVACNEVGSGIIPATPELRRAREATGRLCNRLAKEATNVVRMVSGIPVTIK